MRSLLASNTVGDAACPSRGRRRIWMVTLTVLLTASLLATVSTPVPAVAADPPDHWTQSRRKMVDEEIVAAGVKNPRVIEAVRNTPRHEFVPLKDRDRAYVDMALPIGHGQTISPPFIVAYMTEALDPQPTDKVLEIGTGSGYQAAVLSPLVSDVYTIEIVRALGERAAQTLRRLKKYQNVHTRIGDGFQGWSEAAPFDKIIVTCSPENVPTPLVEQLRDGGRMIIPVGQRYQQTLYVMKKTEGMLVREALQPTLFVPMTGAAEANRQVLPDGAKPVIINGDFEETDELTGLAAGWHYQRQSRLATEDVPHGALCLELRNTESGRASQALQGMAIDGRHVAEIELTAQVTANGVRAGQNPQQLGLIALTFYDELRAEVGHQLLGPFQGTFAWREFSGKFKVPPRAREAIVFVGLTGATGTLRLDDLRLTVIRTK